MTIMIRTNKIKVIVLLNVLLNLVLLGMLLAQEQDSSIVYYKMGNEAYKASNYMEAEHYYMKSLQFKKHPDVYYNLALIHKKKNNSQAYCKNLLEATKLGDNQAAVEFWNTCGKIDTSLLSSRKGTYLIRSICSIVNYEDYRKYNKEHELLLHYFIDCNDTIYIGGKELQNKKWEGTLLNLAKILPKRLIYPIEAIPYKTSGKILLDFVINKKGLIEDVYLLKGLPYGVSKAAINAIKSIDNLGIQSFEKNHVKRKITISLIVDFNAHVSLFKEDMTLVHNLEEADVYQIIQYDLNDVLKATELQFYKSGKQKAITNYINYPKLNKEGSAISYYENGQIKVVANYSNNYLHGDYDVFYENGLKRIVASYNNGIEVSSICYHINGEEIKCEAYEVMPEFPGGDEALFRFIGKEFKIIGPDRLQGVEWVSFRVGVDGTIKNFNIIESLSPEYDRAALALFNKMPKWKPGSIDGKSVEVQCTLPIRCVVLKDEYKFK